MKNSSATFDWRTLLRDLVILIVGIMLSLAMNECRQNARAGNDEERIMRQLIEDVAADTLVLLGMIEELEEALTVFDYLDFPETLATSDRYSIASSVVFIPFQPNRTAMLELSYSNRSGNIERRDLVAKAMALHESDYDQLRQVTDLISEYVTREHLPFITDNLFYSPDTTFEPDEVRRLDAFINSDAFQQRTNWLEILWHNQQDMTIQSLEAARELLEELEAAY